MEVVWDRCRAGAVGQAGSRHSPRTFQAGSPCGLGAEDTDWETIVSLYDKLMTIRPSPVVALNRAIAVAERDGPERGLEEIRAITDSERLATYPFYHAALGELGPRCGRKEVARQHFKAALALARNPMERRFLDHRVHACYRRNPQQA